MSSYRQAEPHRPGTSQALVLRTQDGFLLEVYESPLPPTRRIPMTTAAKRARRVARKKRRIANRLSRRTLLQAGAAAVACTSLMVLPPVRANVPALIEPGPWIQRLEASVEMPVLPLTTPPRVILPQLVLPRGGVHVACRDSSDEQVRAFLMLLNGEEIDGKGITARGSSNTGQTRRPRGVREVDRNATLVAVLAHSSKDDERWHKLPIPFLPRLQGAKEKT